MKIITSGSKYLDIDAYAGCIAYAELLQKLGVNAQAVSTAPLNQTIPPTIRGWNGTLITSYTPSPSDSYTLIDISNPDNFENFVDHSRIDTIIDHHPGFEQYWEDSLGDDALIEHVGAACTQVFEQWEQAGFISQISKTSARLLMCGILDNTLNFGAEITTKRDKDAYKILSQYADLPTDWPSQYFGECQRSVLSDIAQAIQDDTKQIEFKTFPGPVAVGQIAIWDARETIQEAFSTIKEKLSSTQSNWFMNIISISDNKSYFVSEVPAVKRWLTDLIGVEFEDNFAIAERSWLRKELIRADLDRAAKIVA